MGNKLDVGDSAPDFLLLDDEFINVSLRDFEDKNLIIYFYPRDDTPLCALEAKTFTLLIEEFDRIDTVTVGVSTDSVESHRDYKKKHKLGIRLLSDVGCRMAESYGVWVEKSAFGKKYKGVERAAFLIDRNGKILGIWRDKKALGYAETILNATRDILSVTQNA